MKKEKQQKNLKPPKDKRREKAIGETKPHGPLSYLWVLLAGVIQALGLYIFILPNSFSPGGVTGIAAVIQYLAGINSGYFIIALNIPLLIAAWFFFKKEYVIKTAMSITLSSVLLIVLEKINFPSYHTDQPMLAAIAGGVIGGAGLGIIFRSGGSNGGSEIIGGFIQRKFPQYNISWVILVIDTVVVLSTAFLIKAPEGADKFVYALNIIILSITKMFISSTVCSSLLEGFNSAIKFEIVTQSPQELSREIMAEIGRGVTKISARGGYTGSENTVLICIVRKRQIGAFQRILKKYPDTFAYIMNTKEVYGRGFSIPNQPPQGVKSVPEHHLKSETVLETDEDSAEDNA